MGEERERGEGTYFSFIIYVFFLFVIDSYVLECGKWPTKGYSMNFFVTTLFDTEAYDRDCEAGG